MGGRTEAERLAWVHEALRSGLAMEIVKNSGLTYSDVADFVGVSKPTTWSYLNGRIRRPRRAHALRLARLLEKLEKVPRD